MRSPLVVAGALAIALLGADVGAQLPAAPASPAPLDAVLAAHPIVGARVSVLVMDAESGRVLYAREPDAALNPASNAKLVTAAAALSLLGADYRFTTSLHGDLRGEAVVGPLVVRGTGDPSLATADLIAMARQLAASGVRSVADGVLVDDRALGGELLPPAFEQQPRESAAFRASVSGVSVDQNALTVRVRPGALPGEPAIVTADPPGYLEIDAAVSTSDGGPPRVRLEVSPGAHGRERARVTGSFPAGHRGESYRRRIEHPSLAAGYALASALAAVGIRVTGAVRVGALPPGLPALATHQSAALSALLYEVGKDSNNFYAETVLLAIGAQDPRGPVTFARAAERVTEWLRGVGVTMAGLVVRNGSGLFDADRYSALQLAQVMRAAWRDPAIRDEYVAQLAAAGDDGTLRNRLRIAGAERWVRAKTGTLDDAIALSGYVLSPAGGRTLIFSVLTNGVRGHHGEARALADAVAESLVDRVRRSAP